MPLIGRTLTAIDYVVLAAYFVLMLGIGVFYYRQMRGMKDYFKGNNRIPWWLSGVSFYMTSFSVAAFVFYPGLCYRHGFVGVTLLWVAIPATAISALLFAKPWRRARLDSPVEYIETRYSAGLRQLFAWQGVPVKLVDDAIKLLATGKFISICVGLDMITSILLAGGIMLFYTFLGGLWAVAVTDFLQFVVLGAGILVILPLSISKAGGLMAIFRESPDGFFSLTSPEFGWDYIIPLVLMYALGWSSTNWALIQRYYCVPKERDARKVGWGVVALYLVGPPLMFFPAIAAARFMPGLEDAGEVYPRLCAQLLPQGLLGLAIAAMFAATMSTLSGDYNVCASVLTNDVYRRFIRPHASQRELVRVGRIMTLVIGLSALGVACVMAQMKRAEDLFRVMVTLFGVATAPVAVPMLLGLVSKKFTNLSAIVGFLCGLAAGIGLFAVSYIRHDLSLLFFTWEAETQRFLFAGFAFDAEIMPILVTSVVTLVTMVVITAIKPMTPARRELMEPFFKRLSTPIGDLEEERQAPPETETQSPFRVVGVCTVIIGVMLLGLIPWTYGSSAFVPDVGIGVGLLVVGLLMAHPWRK